MRKKTKFNPQAFKAKIIGFGVLIAAGSFLFQNCGQVSSPYRSQNKAVSIGKVSTQGPLQVLGAPNPSSPQMGNRLYTIHPSGQVDVSYYEGDGSIVSSCSINPEDHSMLGQLLQDNSICFYEEDLPEGTLCATVMIPPYFIATSGASQYELGKKTSSCGSTFEMCGDFREPFRSFIQDIAGTLDQTCIF